MSQVYKTTFPDRFTTVTTVPILTKAGETQIIDGDIWVYELFVTNDTNGVITVGLYDGQSPRVPVIPKNDLQPGGQLSLLSRVGRYCPRGIILVSSADGIGVSLSGNTV